jgi:hypothetical protein
LIASEFEAKRAIDEDRGAERRWLALIAPD